MCDRDNGIYRFAMFDIFSCLFADNAGEMKSYEEISNFVIQNETTLTEGVTILLDMDDEIDISIDEKEFVNYIDKKGILKSTDKRNIRNYMKGMKAYKDKNTEIVLFVSDSMGIVGSSGLVGFYYFNDKDGRTIYECMNELKNKEVMNWYYLDYFENTTTKDITASWYFFKYWDNKDSK